MKKLLTFLFLLFVCVISAQSKINFGVKAGYDITKMELSSNVLDAHHRNGNYIGPTMKVDLLAGFDIDASLLYDAKDVAICNFQGESANVSKKSAQLQLNLRKGFGFGDLSDIFVFGGPQWEYDLGKRHHDIFEDGHLRWKEAVLSINVGVGAMIFGTLELKAAYNIACDAMSDVTMKYIVDEIRESPKGSTWQLGISVYF